MAKRNAHRPQLLDLVTCGWRLGLCVLLALACVTAITAESKGVGSLAAPAASNSTACSQGSSGCGAAAAVPAAPDPARSLHGAGRAPRRTRRRAATSMDLPCDTPEEELLSALLLPGTQHTTSAHRQHQRQQQGTPGATGSSHNATSWASHPALLQLSDLGIWHTDFFGGHTYDRASRLRPVSLRYWWRLQCGGDGSGSGGSMSLRGVGTASMQEYAADLLREHTGPHARIPYFMRPSNGGRPPRLLLKDTRDGSWAKLVQEHRKHSPTEPVESINAWHVAASNLSASTSYVLQSGVSPWAVHLVEASRCSDPGPKLFPRGSSVAVITEGPKMACDTFAALLAQHTSYHRTIGLAGAILVVSRVTARCLVTHPALAPGLEAGWYRIIIWDGEWVPCKPYHSQPLWYNLVLLAGWGQGLHLAAIDLDEYLVLPGATTLPAALAPGGCLAGLGQAKFRRYNLIRGTPGAPTSTNTSSSAQEGSQGALLEEGRPLPGSKSVPAQPRLVPRPGEPDGADLIKLGWNKLFRQPSYLDAHSWAPGAHHWAHKSLVNPDSVAWYAVHDGQVLPGGKPSKMVPDSCMFGAHLVNLVKQRSLGSGWAVAVGNSSAPFSFKDHLQKQRRR